MLLCYAFFELLLSLVNYLCVVFILTEELLKASILFPGFVVLRQMVLEHLAHGLLHGLELALQVPDIGVDDNQLLVGPVLLCACIRNFLGLLAECVEIGSEVMHGEAHLVQQFLFTSHL